MNKERYQSILRSHLSQFIGNGRENCILWLHLVSPHYATDVQTLLTSENINFVKRENNPSKLFQAETYKTISKQFQGMIWSKEMSIVSRK